MRRYTLYTHTSIHCIVWWCIRQPCAFDSTPSYNIPYIFECQAHTVVSEDSISICTDNVGADLVTLEIIRLFFSYLFMYVQFLLCFWPCRSCPYAYAKFTLLNPANKAFSLIGPIFILSLKLKRMKKVKYPINKYVIVVRKDSGLHLLGTSFFLS